MRENMLFVGVMVAVCVGYSLSAVAQDKSVQELLEAAQGGHLSAVQSLLSQGVSPKVKDESGRTALHLAAANGHQATAEALLNAGADINVLDNNGKTPLDLAEAGGHSGTSAFLISKGGKTTASAGRTLKPSLRFKTIEEFEKEIGEPAVLLDSPNVCFFVPKRREKEAKIVFPYLTKAYDALYEIVGTHTNYKMAVYAFQKGNPNGWGGTSDCSIEYDDSNLDLERQPEWTEHKVPHVSGYIEEMAHNFVGATKAQFGWEMVGWSLGVEICQKLADNPVWAEELRATREGQKRTFEQYIRNGFVFPSELPPNQCDRIHAWILYKTSLEYGPSFWHDFFREVRGQYEALSNATQLGDADTIRNARYQITIACFDRLPDLDFTRILESLGISLTTDVKSLHPEAPGWDRRLTE